MRRWIFFLLVSFFIFPGLAIATLQVTSTYQSFSDILLDPWKTMGASMRFPRHSFYLEEISLQYVERFGLANYALEASIPLFDIKDISIDGIFNVSKTSTTLFLPEYSVELMMSKLWPSLRAWSSIRHRKYPQLSLSEGQLGGEYYFSDRSHIGLSLGLSDLSNGGLVINYLTKARVTLLPFFDIKGGRGSYVEQESAQLDHVTESFIGIIFPLTLFSSELTLIDQSRSLGASRSILHWSATLKFD